MRAHGGWVVIVRSRLHRALTGRPHPAALCYTSGRRRMRPWTRSPTCPSKTLGSSPTNISLAFSRAIRMQTQPLWHRTFHRLAHSSDAGDAGPVPAMLARLGFSVTPSIRHSGVVMLAAPAAPDRALGVCLVPGMTGLAVCAGKNAYWMSQAVQAVRDHGCEWGMLADGHRLRLLSQGGLRPYESYLQLDFAKAASGNVDGAIALALQNFFGCSSWAPGDAGSTRLQAHRDASQAAVSDCERLLVAQAREALASLHAGYREARIARGDPAGDADELARGDAVDLACRVLVALFAEARAGSLRCGRGGPGATGCRGRDGAGTTYRTRDDLARDLRARLAFASAPKLRVRRVARGTLACSLPQIHSEPLLRPRSAAPGMSPRRRRLAPCRLPGPPGTCARRCLRNHDGRRA